MDLNCIESLCLSNVKEAYTLRGRKKWGKTGRSSQNKFSNFQVNETSLKPDLYDESFLSRPWNFYFKRKVSKYFRKRNVCREILFSLFTQSSFIHAIMTTFHSERELTIFIFLVKDITVLNVWKYWKSAHNYVVSHWGKSPN